MEVRLGSHISLPHISLVKMSCMTKPNGKGNCKMYSSFESKKKKDRFFFSTYLFFALGHKKILKSSC